jgi:hypothetical protein
MQWREIGNGAVIMQYPLRAFAIDFQRYVTLLRLSDGRLVIHSTAPFTPQDAAAIRHFGKPSWLVEATLMHDTFALEARGAFPELPYLVPSDLARINGVPILALDPPPADWANEIEVLRIEGLRKINEHAFLHRASRTLVLADLMFHFPAGAGRWPRFFAKRIMRLPRLGGISAFFRLMIRDPEAFASSMKTILEWDFGQIVVGHGEPIQDNAKSMFAQALRDRGLAPDG